MRLRLARRAVLNLQRRAWLRPGNVVSFANQANVPTTAPSCRPVRPVGGLVSEMPLAEDTGRVACRLEHLGDGRGLQGQPFAFEDGVRDPILEIMTPG
jgi:hypothetical protein